MKTDKNTIIGFVLLGVLFIIFFWYTQKQQQMLAEQQKRQADSLARVNAQKQPLQNTTQLTADSLKTDSLLKQQQAGVFEKAALGTETTTTIENEVMKALFSNKGGQLVSVTLKNFKSYNNQPVVLGGGNYALGYTINTSVNRTAETNDLFFNAASVIKNANGSQTLRYTLVAADGRSIVHEYTVYPNDYKIDWHAQINGANQLLTQNTMNIHWNIPVHQHQTIASYERTQSRLCYFNEDGFDYESASSDIDKEFKKPLHWLSIKQQFFNTTLIANNSFHAGKVQMKVMPDSTHQLFNSFAALQIQTPPAATAQVALQLYFGPNDYHVLKKYNNGMENIVDLGSGVFSFVKYLNRWIIMPVFDLFAKWVTNMGWAILLLTLFIRLIISPLTYTSYLSGAKMRVLKPELDTLRKKFGDDQQGYAMEQMKLFREAGVNPLGGCIPALLQIPIFFALYSFFSSNIALRGESFLWAHDLSTYDVIATLPFSIPFGFGNHISLFTLTAVVTSFLISLYNMSMTPDQSNPALKYMPYIFPFILLFIFNPLPAALTWYYTVSNILTLLIQFVIQQYIIDHDKILMQIEAKRKMPKPKKSKWQERYQEMMEAQKKLQQQKQKNTGKK